MKKLFFLITACLFLFVGCDMNDDYLAYQKEAVCAMVEFSLDGREYEAKLTLSPLVDGAERDAEIRFELPETLRDVTVKRKGGAAFVVLDEIEIPLPPAALSGFFDIADAFSISGTLEKIESRDNMNILSIISEKGRYTVFLDTERKFPCRIDADTGRRPLELIVKIITNN